MGESIYPPALSPVSHFLHESQARPSPAGPSTRSRTSRTSQGHQRSGETREPDGPWLDSRLYVSTQGPDVLNLGSSLDRNPGPGRTRPVGGSGCWEDRDIPEGFRNLGGAGARVT